MMKKFTLPTLLLILSITVANAAIYYVDYAGGSDEADGLTPDSAWKHSPGDSQAAGTPGAHELQPGDLLKFKGGVQYQGEIRFSDVKGTEDQPIVMDGNTDGSYGEGRAVLDGAKMITDWRKVASAEQVGGNPKWNRILYSDVDMDLTSNFNQDRFILHRDGNRSRQAPWQRLFLIDGEDKVLPVAQRPKPSDPFFPDLPYDFYKSSLSLQNDYPHKIYYPEGSKGNSSLPLIAITYGGAAPVIEPFAGGEVALDLDKPTLIAEMGFKLFRPKSVTPNKQIAFYADGEEIYVAEVDPKDGGMQRFKLPEPVEASTITFQLRHTETGKRWTKLQQLAAYTPEGENIIKHEIGTVIEDPERITQDDSDWYDDMFVGVHGGNNHVYFAKVRSYDPDTNRLSVPHFSPKKYNTTRYAFFNSPKLIDLPGEWTLEPLDGGGTRIYFLPEDASGGQPENIGYPTLKTAVAIVGASSHIKVQGFLMQRYAGGQGGVGVNRRDGDRPSDIHIADCEIRFMSGQSGISLNHSDNVTVENCYVHHCPGWTVGIYVNRITGYNLLNTRVDYNSGSGIRHYEAKQGVLRNNVVSNHHGMHSSGINFYEGSRDILFEDNYIQNLIAINRSAENLHFRNNVVDGLNKSSLAVAMWVSGRVGGTHLKNLVFENNTFVNTNTNIGWHSAIFPQSGKASKPEGLVVRNNILSRLRPPFPGTVENNIFMLETPASVAGGDSLLVGDPEVLFIDPGNGDYRRKPGGPKMDVGANVPPPPLRGESP